MGASERRLGRRLPSAFGYAWRGFRLLRRRRRLSVLAVARRSGVTQRVIAASEERHGNIDCINALRLLEVYGAGLVDLGLMTKLADRHLTGTGDEVLRDVRVVAIIAEFERLKVGVGLLDVPLPDCPVLRREIEEIEQRIGRLQDFLQGKVIQPAPDDPPRELGAAPPRHGEGRPDFSRLSFRYSAGPHSTT